MQTYVSAPSGIGQLIAQALIIADRQGLLRVSIHLNEALVALGHPGIAPPDNVDETTVVIETTQ